jgi:Lon protease-like protein
VHARRFRVLDMVQLEPYAKAVVEWLQDSNSKPEDEVLQMEMDCWKTLQEVVWLCVEVRLGGCNGS